MYDNVRSSRHYRQASDANLSNILDLFHKDVKWYFAIVSFFKGSFYLWPN